MLFNLGTKIVQKHSVTYWTNEASNTLRFKENSPIRVFPVELTGVGY